MAAEHGFLFKPEMVRALLDGRKSRTRRICTAHNSTINGGPTGKALWARLDWSVSPAYPKLPAPYADSSAEAGQYWHVPMRPHPVDPQNNPDLWTVHRVYPRVAVGDVVWVRETWAMGGNGPYYRADVPQPETVKYAWGSAMLMPRWASRILLRVTAIRAQRVQEISDADALAEGAAPGYAVDCIRAGHPFAAVPLFRALWDSCNGHRPGCAWEDNPPVWAYTFERLEAGR